MLALRDAGAAALPRSFFRRRPSPFPSPPSACRRLKRAAIPPPPPAQAPGLRFSSSRSAARSPARSGGARSAKRRLRGWCAASLPSSRVSPSSRPTHAAAAACLPHTRIPCCPPRRRAPQARAAVHAAATLRGELPSQRFALAVRGDPAPPGSSHPPHKPIKGLENQTPNGPRPPQADVARRSAESGLADERVAAASLSAVTGLGDLPEGPGWLGRVIAPAAKGRGGIRAGALAT